MNAAHYYALRGAHNINLFLQEVALLQEKLAQDATQQPVQLITLHAAKGLEFPVVFITGLEDGIFPSSRSLDNEANLEEERRLLYVGITRAKNKVILSWAENRFIFGSVSCQLPSRFLKELPTKTPGIQFTEHAPHAFTRILHEFFQVNQEQSDMLVFPARRQTPLPWCVHQTVTHQKFGIGMIQAVEEKSYKTILIIRFQSGIKRIASSFVKA